MKAGRRRRSGLAATLALFCAAGIPARAEKPSREHARVDAADRSSPPADGPRGAVLSSQRESAWVPEGLALKQQYQGPTPPMPSIPPSADGWRRAGLEPVRGITIGPIESTLQAGRGYGSSAFEETLGEVTRMGANWISLTVFGRVWDLEATGVDPTFEQPSEVTRQMVRRSVALAHRRGLRVLLVPHLWLESGQWRAEMQPRDFEAWKESYTRFVVGWAEVAQESEVDLLAAGVELRSWVTTDRAPSFLEVLAALRATYDGPLTYAANWDDAADTVIWNHLDVLGVNAFYPLHWEDDASYEQVEAGGYRVAEEVEELARRFERPVLFTEFGYTARSNTAIKPWLWPEELGQVTRNEEAQERAYEALLGAMTEVPGFAGTLVWRMYADVSDLSQEPDWGFSPWGKRAERQLRRLYQTARKNTDSW